MSSSPPQVALFVTCLVDALRPNIAFAAAKLLEDAGCHVVVPPHQSCCGQPAFNSGDDATTKALAKDVVATFAPFDYTVVPSGSCRGMMDKYGELLADDPVWRDRHAAWLASTFELLSFLTDVLDYRPKARYRGQVAYHDSCSSLRQLRLKRQPRQLLAGVEGLQLLELADGERCCGFGGTFCVKYPAISNAMVAAKAASIQAAGADTLASNDLGCLLNIAGKLSRDQSPVRCFHAAEILADMTEQAICQG